MGSKPPHLLSNEERNKTVDIEKMYLDLGVKDKAEVEALGIKVGDMVLLPSISKLWLIPTFACQSF